MLLKKTPIDFLCDLHPKVLVNLHSDEEMLTSFIKQEIITFCSLCFLAIIP